MKADQYRKPMIADFREIASIKEILGKNPKGMSITEIANELGLHRNTVAKYLDVLQMKGDVELKKVGTAKNYFISSRLPVSSLRAFSRSDYLLANSRLDVIEAGGPMVWAGTMGTGCVGLNILDIPLSFVQGPGFRDVCHAALNGRQIVEEIAEFIGDREWHFRVSILPVVLDDGREGLGMVLCDITACRRTGLLLKHCQEQYRTLAEDQGEYLFRAKPDGTITSVNDAFCRKVRKKREDIIGFRYVPMVSAEDRSRLNTAMSEISPDSPAGVVAYQVTDPEGENRWEEWKFRGTFGSDRGLVEYQAVGRDITDLRRMQEQIRTYQNNLEILVTQRTKEMKQANQMLMNEIAEREKIERELLFTQFAFDHASDSIILFDRDGLVYKANQTGCRLLGYTPEGIREMTIFEINPEITRDCWNRMWANSEEVTWKRVISVHRKKDGSIISVDLSRSFVKFGDREYFCSIARERV
jgi:PAS domain S-box-containing protein